LLALTFAFVALAVFTREEAYTLPVALPLLWWLSSSRKSDYRRVIGATLGITAIVALQYILRTIFIPEAPQPTLQIAQLWLPFRSAWMPGGATYVAPDHLINFAWIGFLCFLATVFIRFSDKCRIELVFGICVLGLVLCTPALAVPRSFGTALPSLAFFTAIAIALDTVRDVFSSERYGQGLWRPAIFATCLIGLALGVTAGVRRSIYVSEALDQYAVGTVIQNAAFLFAIYPNPVTMPESRRRAVLAYLNELGISSREDLIKLRARVAAARLGESDPPILKPPMFYERYEYMPLRPLQVDSSF
jgi:hypothetical protein